MSDTEPNYDCCLAEEFCRDVQCFISWNGLNSDYIEITSVDFDEDCGWYATGEGKYGDYFFAYDEEGSITMQQTVPRDTDESQFTQERSLTEILFDVTWEVGYLIHIGMLDGLDWVHDQELYEYCLNIAEEFQSEYSNISEEDGYLDNVVAFTREKFDV